MLDSSVVLELSIALVAAAFILLSGMFVLRRLKQRRSEVAGELERSRHYIEDRAYNQVRIARAEADVLAHRGVDVGAPRRQIEEAEAAAARRDPEEALRLARSAHESLLRLKDRPAAGGAPPVASIPATGVRREAALTTGAAPPDPPRPSPLPKNKAESRFQIKLLESDLAGSAAKSAAGEPAAEAHRLLGEATAAYEQGDFTRALGLALRGRRRAGGRLETLGPAPGRAAPTPAVGGPDPGGTVSGGTPPGSGAACPVCGAPLRPGDQFCRGCGTPRAATRCPSCGTPTVGADRFCGGCGFPLSETAR